MQRRSFLKALLWSPVLSWLGSLPTWAGDGRTGPLLNIGFGSCVDQDQPDQPIWDVIRGQKPDLFVLLGDNIYADTDDMDEMARRYAKQAAQPNFARFRQEIPIVATWDDHDYGLNDGGAEYGPKEASKKQMLDFFGEPADSPRRRRDGVYTSYFVGEPGRRAQIILLDLRWFRGPLVRDERGYSPNPDPGAQLLGEEQWQWLEAQLRLPADLRILGSSTQLVAPDTQWEKWANFPFEKARLFQLLDRMGIRNLAVISGDMHYGEFSQEKTPGGIPVYDMTSSGMNYYESSEGIPNAHRVEVFDRDCNYGWLQIDWTLCVLTMQVRDSRGVAMIEKRLAF